MKPKSLDLFCRAGGCTKGYQDAGFYVVGVDINPQPRYVGDEFIQADVMTWLPVAIKYGYTDQFAVIHASPPCQLYTELNGHNRNDYPDLIAPIRELLKLSGRPYVIENVGGARRKLESPVMLCGHQFGLKVYRHRWFETSPFILSPPHLPHPEPCPKSGRGKSPKYGFISVTGDGGTTGGTLGMPYMKYASAAMGIDWMNRNEISEAIPPAYTRYIGERLLAQGVAV